MNANQKRFFLVLVVTLLLGGCTRSSNNIVVMNSSFQNLLTNPGFENGTTGFMIIPEADGTALTVPDAAYSGVAGLRLFRTGVEPESLPMMQPRKVYALSFRARLANYDPAGATETYPYVQVDTGYNSLSQPGLYVPETANKIRIKSNSWERYQYYIEPGDRPGHYWKMLLRLTSGPGTNNVVDFDDLALEEVQFE